MKIDKIIKKRKIEETDFFRKWLKVFAPEMTMEQFKKYIEGQYIWHAFSWEIIPKEKYLKGDAARQAYDRADKTGALCFRLWADDKPFLLTEKFDSAEKIENSDESSDEFYVIGKNYSWTYLLTHETCCGLGPYFMLKI